jgi:hypothetical protein
MTKQQHGYLLWVKAQADGESQSNSFHATLEEAKDKAIQYYSSRPVLQITSTGNDVSSTWMFDYDVQEWTPKSRKV